MWRTDTDDQEYRAYMDRAYQDRAEAVSRISYNAIAGLADAVRWLSRPALTLGRTTLENVVRWQERRSTLRVLEALDDRLLKDVGLYRGDLRTIADELLSRRTSLEAVNDNRQTRETGAANDNVGATRADTATARTGAPVPVGCG